MYFFWGQQKTHHLSWNPKQPFINRCLVISNNFLCKDSVHHPIDSQPLAINGWPQGVPGTQYATLNPPPSDLARRQRPAGCAGLLTGSVAGGVCGLATGSEQKILRSWLI